MPRNSREVSAKLLKVYLSPDVFEQVEEEARKYDLTLSDMMKFSWCMYRKTNEPTQAKKEILKEENYHTEALKLKDKDIVECTSLHVSEILVREYGFRVVKVQGADQQKQTVKVWHLVSPYFVEKSENERISEKKDLFSEDLEPLEDDLTENYLLKELE